VPAPRGRFWLVLWLLFALGVLAWVNARQTSSVVLAGELRTARAERAAAEAEWTRLQRRLREAGSRGVLIPKVERMGLRSAADTEIVTLRVTPEER
jgi:cell division protein FtsL